MGGWKGGTHKDRQARKATETLRDLEISNWFPKLTVSQSHSWVLQIRLPSCLCSTTKISLSVTTCSTTNDK